MATYVIFIREGEIVDEEAMAKYQKGDGSEPPPASLKPLTVYGKMETFEGEPADGIVILEFPDNQAAKDWYFSDDYQRRSEWRKKAAPYRCIMVEGL